jgi:y4mF family transcriptional regulator
MNNGPEKVPPQVMAKAREVGGLVRQLRRKAGLTQLELARLAGVGKTVVFDIEKGKPSVRLTTLLRVLLALNVEVRLESPLPER